MQFRIKHRENPVIEIAPLVDVVFLLLLFFMVTTQFIAAPGLQINLPEITPGAPIATSAKIEISINAAKDIFISGNPTPKNKLKQILKKTITDPGTTVIVLSADKNVPHGEVINVMDVLRELGIKKLVIAARWKEQPGLKKK